MKQKLDFAKSTVAFVAAAIALTSPLVSYFLARATTPLCGLSLSYSVPYGRGSIPLRLYEVANPGPADLQEVTLAFTIDHPFNPNTSSPQRSIEIPATADVGADSSKQAGAVRVAYMNVDVIGPNTVKGVDGLSDNANCRYQISPNKKRVLGAGDSFGVVITGEVAISDMSLSYSRSESGTNTLKVNKDTPLVCSVNPSSLSASDFLLFLFGIVCLGIAVLSIRRRATISLRSVEMPPDVSPEQALRVVERATPEEVSKAALLAIIKDLKTW